MRFNYLLSSGILFILTFLLFFSQPSIHRTGTGVCRHVAVPVASELPAFLPYISRLMTACIMRFILFIIFRHSLYTDIFIIFLTSRHSQNWHQSVLACYCAGCQCTQHFLLYLSPGTMRFILFIIFQHSLYTSILIIFFSQTQHLQNQHRSVPPGGCAACWRATSIYCYIYYLLL